MQFTATLLALFSLLAAAQAAPTPAPSPEPVVDRLSIVAANRARMSSYVESSRSAASDASVASASSASAASRASIASVRLAIVASNRARMSEYIATRTSGFATVTTAAPTSTSTSSASVSSSTTTSLQLPPGFEDGVTGGFGKLLQGICYGAFKNGELLPAYCASYGYDMSAGTRTEPISFAPMPGYTAYTAA